LANASASASVKEHQLHHQHHSTDVEEQRLQPLARRFGGAVHVAEHQDEPAQLNRYDSRRQRRCGRGEVMLAAAIGGRFSGGAALSYKALRNEIRSAFSSWVSPIAKRWS
jgi:hypothetical protein